MEQICVTSFYRFTRWDPEMLNSVSAALEGVGIKHGLGGLILIAPEGINATVAGTDEAVAAFKALVGTLHGCLAIEYKDSRCGKIPFSRYKVDRREEIISYDPAVVPQPDDRSTHLTPAEWHGVLTGKDEYVLIDARNSYETELGRFPGAIDPQIENFADLREFAERAALPKEKKILLYCTGGVRCEKAAVDFKQMGFKSVFQLEGGILKYLEEFPEGCFEGECFVFDHRVALDRNLKPTAKFRFCPHCGQPGERRIKCAECGKAAVICDSCGADSARLSCSKNCAYHQRRKTSPAESVR